MGRHYRRGHYRTSKNGNVHWVSGHSVDRNRWSSTGRYTTWPKPRPAQPLPAQRAQVRVTPTARATLSRPNATCPVCGASVYFYSNAAGSKVYFDDLGPPWPKHPCMDLRARRGNVSNWSATPAAWPLVASAYEHRSSQNAVQSAARDQRAKHGGEVLEWCVRRVDIQPNGTHLQLSRGGPRGPVSWWFIPYLVRVHPGHPVFSTNYFGSFASFSYVDIVAVEVMHANAHRTRASLGELLISWRPRRR